MRERRVGRLYDPAITRWPERISYQARGRAQELVVFLDSPTARQVEGVELGRVELGLVVRRPVLLWLVRIVPGLGWSEAEINWHRLPEAERELPPAPAGGELPLLHVLLVRANGGEIAARRTMPLSAAVGTTLERELRRQAGSRWDQARYERRLGDLRSRYPVTEQMLTLLRVRCASGC
jgi:hypothetical protein